MNRIAGSRTRLVVLFVFAGCGGLVREVRAGPAAAITVQLDQPIGQIDPRIFGHFTEEVLTSYEGGVCSEMLFNRKFEIPEERKETKVPSPLVIGTGSGWDPIELDNSVSFVPDRQVYFSPSQSQRITHSGGQVVAGIQQKGYRFVMPQLTPLQRIDDPFHFKPGEQYLIRLAIKSRDLKGPVHVALGQSPQNAVAHHAFILAGPTDWQVCTCALSPEAEAAAGKFMIYIDTPGTIWVDSVSMVRADLDDGGFRKDVLEATRRICPTSLRWPGGCFVSDYAWQDGIGPVDQRPARWNRPWLAWYSNDVGVGEFISLCHKLNAQPYLCVNVGTGSPEEAAALVEYVNGDASTRGGQLRARDGHPEPYHVRDWNIGNEEYLPNLGSARGAVYAEKFAAFASAMRAVDPSIELVAVGAFDAPRGALPRQHPAYPVLRYVFDWNEQVLPVAGRQMNHYSIHHYEPSDSAKGLSARDVNQSALVKAEDLATKLERLFGQMERHCPGGKRFPIALDEWAVWLPQEIPPEASIRPPAGLTDPARVGTFGSTLALRDALSEAAVYNLMQRRPGDFSIASRTILYAYAMGLFGISRDGVVASPPARMLEMYATAERCQSLRTAVSGPTFDFAARDGFSGAKGASFLDVSARRGSDGKTIELFVVNRSLDDDIETRIEFSGKPVEPRAALAVLNARSLTEWNSFAEPDRVSVVRSESRLSVSVPILEHRFAAHSLTKVTVRLK
jgi:alpha-N-arabinofuranosidase